jgi:hypothetical protein
VTEAVGSSVPRRLALGGGVVVGAPSAGTVDAVVEAAAGAEDVVVS